MITDQSINKYIEAELIRANEERAKKHEPSGKLSASMLYQPVRFQVMKTIGVPRREIDPYVLGKFKRGNDVEDWYVKQLEGHGLLEAQKEVSYRDTVGIVDAVVDSKGWDFEDGTIPHEVKSVTNAKFARIKKTGVDYHYKLQGALYALALGTDHYAIDIVASEDYRVKSCIFKTKRIKRDVDQIISRYLEAIENWARYRELPELEALDKSVSWTLNPKYAMFDKKWIKATSGEIQKLLERTK